jgi:uncharacterized repeat protein (TIGR03803 family)
MWLPYVKNDAINSAVETLTTLSTEPWDNPSCNDAPGCGTVFQLTSSGTLTVLYSFSNGTDGGDPFAGLIADEAGNLYGTTWDGGDSGRGTVFQLDPSGTLTVLHSFTGGSDGQRPVTGLIADAAGNLYGTAHSGGDGYGTVFQLTPSGALTVLYSFTGGTDGGDPTAGVIADAAGNLYGTTLEGGATASCNRPYGCGRPGPFGPWSTPVDREGLQVAAQAFEAKLDGAEVASSRDIPRRGHWGRHSGSALAHESSRDSSKSRTERLDRDHANDRFTARRRQPRRTAGGPVRHRGDGLGRSKDKTRPSTWMAVTSTAMTQTGNSRLFLQQKWVLKHPLGGADQVLRGLADERASAVAHGAP